MLSFVCVVTAVGCGDDDASAVDAGREDAVTPELDTGLEPDRDSGPDPATDLGPEPDRDAGPADAGGGSFVLPDGPLRSVSIGESWTEGDGDETSPPGWPPVVGEHLATARPGSMLENFGCSGWSAPQLLSEGCYEMPPPIERVEASGADLVLVLIGANDITDWSYEEPERLGDYDAARYETALREVHDRIAAAGARVVQVEVPDVTRFPVARVWTPEKRETIDARIRAANLLIAEIVAEHGGRLVHIHDIEALYDPANFIGDGVHLTHTGYAIVGEAVWSALEADIR